jgi:hypothetical protein
MVERGDVCSTTIDQIDAGIVPSTNGFMSEIGALIADCSGLLFGIGENGS